jgi:hypothetical protein
LVVKSPWPDWSNCAAHHLQKVIVDQKLKSTRLTYSGRIPETGFCGKSVHALFAPRTLGSKKLCFAGLGVQLVDQTRKRVRAGHLNIG